VIVIARDLNMRFVGFLNAPYPTNIPHPCPPPAGAAPQWLHPPATLLAAVGSSRASVSI
jgi:hypothetical protein